MNEPRNNLPRDVREESIALFNHAAVELFGCLQGPGRQTGISAAFHLLPLGK